MFENLNVEQKEDLKINLRNLEQNISSINGLIERLNVILEVGELGVIEPTEYEVADDPIGQIYKNLRDAQDKLSSAIEKINSLMLFIR